MSKPCLVITTGTSLCNFDWTSLPPIFIVAVNGAAWFVNADVLVSLHTNITEILDQHFGHSASYKELITDPEASQILEKYGALRLDSGIVGLAVAVDRGYSPIYLLGYDNYYDKGYTHFYDTAPSLLKQDRRYPLRTEPMIQQAYGPFMGREIYNLNPASMLDGFEFMDWEEARKRLTSS
jgi:hypothetical protein